jgi:hypothetical protein
MVKTSLLLIFLATFLLAQPTQTSPLDPRLSPSTLLREDVFAGVLNRDDVRLQRAEINIQTLLTDRPEQKPLLLAWKGMIAAYRAVWVNESKRKAAFIQQYNIARDLFSEASTLAPNSVDVAAIYGGTMLLIGPRLPELLRPQAYSSAYNQYQIIFKQQEPVVDKLPLHLKGELLAGMAESAYRTDRAETAAQFLNRITEEMPNTPYAVRAAKWKQDPKFASGNSLVCQSCHEQGRLVPRMAALAK